MFVVSLVSSSIALALRRALAQLPPATAARIWCYETNRMLQRCADQHQIVHAMATQLARLSGCPVVWYSADAEGDDLLPRATYTAVGDAAPVHELAPQMPPRLSASVHIGNAARRHVWRLGVLWHLPDGSHRRRLRALGRPCLGGGRAGYRCRARRADARGANTCRCYRSEGELALDRARAMEAREEAAVLAKTNSCAQPAALHLARSAYAAHQYFGQCRCPARSGLDRHRGARCPDAPRPAPFHSLGCAMAQRHRREPARHHQASRVAVCACRPHSSSWTISSRRCAT